MLYSYSKIDIEATMFKEATFRVIYWHWPQNKLLDAVQTEIWSSRLHEIPPV